MVSLTRRNAVPSPSQPKPAIKSRWREDMGPNHASYAPFDYLAILSAPVLDPACTRCRLLIRESSIPCLNRLCVQLGVSRLSRSRSGRPVAISLTGNPRRLAMDAECPIRLTTSSGNPQREETVGLSRCLISAKAVLRRVPQVRSARGYANFS
jgi:hypothetical protein